MTPTRRLALVCLVASAIGACGGGSNAGDGTGGTGGTPTDADLIDGSTGDAAGSPDVSTVDATADAPDAGTTPDATIDGSESDAKADATDSAVSDAGDAEAGADAADAGGPIRESAPLGLTDVGTLVVAGDSISSAESPTSYAILLRDKLRARYGAVTYHNVAVAGGETTGVPAQIDALPATLAGPVVVAMTAGGNDLKNDAPRILAGDLDLFFAIPENVGSNLDLILEPDRFGPGVDVFIVHANVYDPTDGQGNFGDFGCAFGSGADSIDLDAVFNALNERMAQQITDRGQSVLDLWGLFRFHGLNYDPTWFRDCMHPGELGNDALQRKFYELITGETLP